jgi:hypothetical protein
LFNRAGGLLVGKGFLNVTKLMTLRNFPKKQARELEAKPESAHYGNQRLVIDFLVIS